MISKFLTISSLLILSQPGFSMVGKGIDMEGVQREFPLSKVVIEDDFFGDEEFYTLSHGKLEVKSAFSQMFGGATAKFGKYVKADSSGVISDPVAVSTYNHALITIKHLREKLNFDFNTPVRIVVDQYLEAPWTMDAPNLSYSEAGYIRDLRLIAFSPGSVHTTSLAKSLDIVAHEIAHLVVAQTSKLTPNIGSQAVNEAFGDLVGIYVESLESPNNWNWKIGDESYKDGVSFHRDIQDKNDPRVLRHKNDFTAERAHALSGIVTTSFYYLITGTDLEGNVVMPPTNIDIAMKLYFETITQDLDPNTNFTKLKQALLNRADLELKSKVEKAFDMVGV